MKHTTLQPMWVVGFTDGEGCFTVSLIQNKHMTFGMQIQPEFIVTQHQRDTDLLYKLKTFFGCGQVSKGKGTNDSTDHTMKYRVRKNADLCDKIIPFFEKHPLKTKKNVEFLQFRDICLMQKKQVHLTPEGFQQCLQLSKQVRFSAVLENEPVVSNGRVTVAHTDKDD